VCDVVSRIYHPRPDRIDSVWRVTMFWEEGWRACRLKWEGRGNRGQIRRDDDEGRRCSLGSSWGMRGRKGTIDVMGRRCKVPVSVVSIVSTKPRCFSLRQSSLLGSGRTPSQRLPWTAGWGTPAVAVSLLRLGRYRRPKLFPRPFQQGGREKQSWNGSAQREENGENGVGRQRR